MVRYIFKNSYKVAININKGLEKNAYRDAKTDGDIRLG
jgi:hypothetical protein